MSAKRWTSSEPNASAKNAAKTKSAKNRKGGARRPRRRCAPSFRCPTSRRSSSPRPKAPDANIHPLTVLNDRGKQGSYYFTDACAVDRELSAQTSHIGTSGPLRPKSSDKLKPSELLRCDRDRRCPDGHSHRR